MASVDVIKYCFDSIRQISDEVSDAILYLDAGCLEAFQLLGVFPLLLELGVRAVCSLENVSSLDLVADWNSTYMKPAKRMVVFTSRLLSDAHRYILRCLSTHHTVLRCTIFTSISEIAHTAYVDSPLGPDAFREYESLLLQDYEELVKNSKIKDPFPRQPKGSHHSEENKFGKKRIVSENEGWSQLASSEDEIPSPGPTFSGKDLDEPSSTSCTEDGFIVSVHHFPMIMCALSPRVFILPSEGAISEACLSNNHEDSLSPGLPTMVTGSPSDGEDTPGAILTAHFLYHLATKMDLKLEVFSLGDLSKTIGKVLTDMSSLYDVGRRNKRSAGLLLIDRTLDLITPCSHGDSLVDRILSSLPRRERTTSSAHMKASQISNKNISPNNLQRHPFDIQIPIERIFGEESEKLLESISDFVSGWNSTNLDVQSSSGKSSTQIILGLPSGSLVSTENYQGAAYLEALLDRNAKDGALLIRKWLQEALRREKMNLNVKSRPGFATPSELHSMVKMLSSNEASLIRNKGIIQLASAAEISLSDPHSSRWDAFVSAERVLRLSAGDMSQSLSCQICDLINKSIMVGPDIQKSKAKPSQGGLFSLQDALVLAIIGYILAGESFPTAGSGGPFSWEEERSLKEAIIDVIIENPPVMKFRFLNGLEEELEANFKKKSKEISSGQSMIKDFDDQWGSWDDEDTDVTDDQAYGDMQLRLELRDRVDQVFKLFHKVSGLKRRTTVFREGLFSVESNILTDNYANKGLLYKLLTMVLANYDVPGLEYHSSVVGRLFKSGFGRFGLGQAKPKLGDQSVILVFVVGGINGLEVREAQEAVAESGRPDVELIFGGTSLLTPDDMFDLLLGSSSYI